MTHGRRAWFACLLAAAACSRGSEENAPAAARVGPPQPPYFGQRLPGTTPEKFAPGVVSTDAVELNGVFTPDGREFFFTRIVDGVDTMYRSVIDSGKWSDPQPLLLFPDRERAVAVDMSVSPDGRELYFLGQNPRQHAGEQAGSDLWVSPRGKDGWSTARLLPPPLSTPAEEVYPVVVADGSLYFVSNREDGKHSQLYRAQRQPDGSFAEPVKVGP